MLGRHSELSECTDAPYPFERGWEALIVRLAQNFFYNHIDFWRIEPRGRFYQRRALEDDINASRGNRIIPPMKVLDFLLVIGRVAEAIGVGVQFVKGLGCDPTQTLLNFAFRWTKLRVRVSRFEERLNRAGS
jgi:hypothetical protein